MLWGYFGVGFMLGDWMDFRGTIIIKKEEEWFVATCLENNIASQGKTIDDATENLKEAIALYYEDEPEAHCNYSKT